MLHQVSHEILDPVEEDTLEFLAANTFYLSTSMFLAIIIMVIFSVELKFSYSLLNIYTALICRYVYYSPHINKLFFDFVLCAIIISILGFFLFYS